MKALRRADNNFQLRVGKRSMTGSNSLIYLIPYIIGLATRRISSLPPRDIKK